MDLPDILPPPPSCPSAPVLPPPSPSLVFSSPVALHALITAAGKPFGPLKVTLLSQIWHLRANFLTWTHTVTVKDTNIFRFFGFLRLGFPAFRFLNVSSDCLFWRDVGSAVLDFLCFGPVIKRVQTKPQFYILPQLFLILHFFMLIISVCVRLYSSMCQYKYIKTTFFHNCC